MQALKIFAFLILILLMSLGCKPEIQKTPQADILVKVPVFNADTAYHFVEKQLDVRPYLALADLFVIPTKNEGRKEGLPIAPMEAMACGRIVLGSNITGIKEVLEEFPKCLFEAGNITELASKITYIKKMNYKERRDLGSLMRNYIEQELSITKFICEHEILYKKLLKSE